MNKHFVYTVCIFLALLLVAGFLYTQVFAVVGASIISQKDWNQDLVMAKKFDASADPATVKEVFIKNFEKGLLVDSLNIKYDQARIDAEFKFETKDKGQLPVDEKSFIKFITLPQLYDALLRIKYNSGVDVNIEAYKRAQNILASIKNGSKFEDLAKTESEDKASGQLGGDLGFVSEGQILPELFDAVKTAKVGEVSKNIVITRDGLHIIYPVETGEKNSQALWHIKHILITTTGYDDWLNGQLSRIWVWHLR